MKNDIVIHTELGPVILAVTTPTTFDLRGPREAIESLQGLAPVLQTEGNSTDIAGDVLARVVYHTANEGLDSLRRERKLMDHEALKLETFTENPVVLFQVREELTEIREQWARVCENCDIPASSRTFEKMQAALDEADAWKTIGVFIDPEEAQDFARIQRHRYSEANEGKTWRTYCGVANGALKAACRLARDLDNLGSNQDDPLGDSQDETTRPGNMVDR